MNDLKHGIIDINGFLLTPQTKPSDIEEYFNTTLFDNGVRKHFYFDKKTFNNNGIDFHIDASFKETIKELILRPDIPEIQAKYNLDTDDRNERLEYYKELRVVLDKWLEEQLGDPLRKNERNTSYEFENILINTCSYFIEQPHGFEIRGGGITIWYE